MARYTVLRLLVFFGCLTLLWLLGLRSREDEVFLVGGAAVLSLAISYVVLRPFREQASTQLSRRIDARRAKAAARQESDADAASEDAEVEARGEDFR